jgi:hypothetical protein
MRESATSTTWSTLKSDPNRGGATSWERAPHCSAPAGSLPPHRCFRRNSNGKNLRAFCTGIARDPNYNGKGLEPELAVEDEGVFTMRCSASMIYWPPLVPMGQWPEITCAENPNA